MSFVEREQKGLIKDRYLGRLRRHGLHRMVVWTASKECHLAGNRLSHQSPFSRLRRGGVAVESSDPEYGPWNICMGADSFVAVSLGGTTVVDGLQASLGSAGSGMWMMVLLHSSATSQADLGVKRVPVSSWTKKRPVIHETASDAQMMTRKTATSRVPKSHELSENYLSRFLSLVQVIWPAPASEAQVGARTCSTRPPKPTLARSYRYVVPW